MTSVSENISGAVNAVVSSSLLAEAYGLIGRGVKGVYINVDNELIFVMTDGSEINVGEISACVTLPVASADTIGGIRVGESLRITDGVLSVDTATVVQQDNTKPVTSGAVHTEIVNIEALLEKI